MQQIATLGGGCFWCLEAPYRETQGVESAVSGYMGGARPNPTYEAVCSGTTGHVEVVQVTFDSDVISYREILEIFFTLHDPTTLNRQGNDVGTQYRSAIYAHSDAQAATAASVMKEIADAKIWGPAALVTELAPFAVFYEAEPEHHDYFARNPYTGYCQVVVAPKVAKFRKQFTSRLKRA